MLITFSGLDGAGKSTLIEFLSTALQREQRRVAVLHLNDQVGVYAYLRQLRDLLLRRTAKELPPGEPDPRSQLKAPQGTLRGYLSRIRTAILWNEPVRRLLYPVDLVLFALYRIWLEKCRGRVLIMDRYFYDTLVDISNGRDRIWTRLFERITPQPTLPVFLDVSPEESHRRKGEFSVEYLRRRYQAYQRVFARVPGALHIVNNNLDNSEAVLLGAVRSRTSAR